MLNQVILNKSFNFLKKYPVSHSFDLILILEHYFSTMMPHTGVNPRFICLDNGTFILNGTQEEVPVCVPKTSCRLPEFPNDIADTWGYEHNNTEKGNLIVKSSISLLNII